MKHILLAWLFLATSLVAHAKDSDDCNSRMTAHAAVGRVYAYGATEQTDPTANIQFGFESEYMLSEVEGLLNYYAPANEPGLNWAMKTPDERKAWIREKYGNKPEFAADTELVKIGGDTKMAFLPEKLILDATGNLEIVLPPVDSFDVWAHQVEAINSTIGVGSMQAMLSAPKKYFFAGKPEVSAAENLGWFTFTADLDTLTKLESGAARYAKDPSKEVARPFLHQWLGPLPRVKWVKLKEFLLANARGENFDKETLKFLKTDASFKYIGGSAYRPDIAGPTRVGIELRSAHKDQKLLFAQVQRDMGSLASDRTPYAAFADVEAFDSVGDYAKLPPLVRTQLEKLFPARLDPRFEYNADETLSNQVYRNFSYPLRGWGNYLTAMGATPEVRKKVLLAQGAYVKKLVDIEHRVARGELSDTQAAVAMQGAVATFAVESGLAQFFREYQQWIEGQRKVSALERTLTVA